MVSVLLLQPSNFIRWKKYESYNRYRPQLVKISPTKNQYLQNWRQELYTKQLALNPTINMFGKTYRHLKKRIGEHMLDQRKAILRPLQPRSSTIKVSRFSPRIRNKELPFFSFFWRLVPKREQMIKRRPKRNRIIDDWLPKSQWRFIRRDHKPARPCSISMFLSKRTWNKPCRTLYSSLETRQIQFRDLH